MFFVDQNKCIFFFKSKFALLRIFKIKFPEKYSVKIRTLCCWNRGPWHLMIEEQSTAVRLCWVTHEVNGR